MNLAKLIAIAFRKPATTSMPAPQVPLFERCEGRVLMAIDFEFDSTATAPLSDFVVADFSSGTTDIASKKKSRREVEKLYDKITTDDVVTFDESDTLHNMSTGSTPK